MTALPHEGMAALTGYLEQHGWRYELLDGSVLVSPPASFDHEDLAAEVLARLRVACPPHLAVLGPNFGYFYEGYTTGPPVDSFLLPDVQVVRRDDAQPWGTQIAPLLVVETLSRSTRRRDTGEKWDVYAERGIERYWIVDPQRRELLVLRRRGGTYVEEDRGQRLELTEPYPVTIDLRR